MQASRPFRTAIVPAAGLGTRFLPTTKTVPKELLPVIDTPGIEIVAAEAAEAGAARLLIVTSPGKDAIAAHFAPQPELVATLTARGKEDLAEKVRRASELIEVGTVDQDQPRGLGHAVGCAGDALEADEDAVAVLLPDDLVLPTGVLLTIFNMMAVAQDALTMILAIVGVIVLLYVFVAMYSATLERKREIATMRALGARRATVLGIVLVESCMLSAIGGIAGILAGHVAAYLAAAMLAATSGLVTEPFRIDALQPAVLAAVILLGTLAGLLPAVLAYRTEVAENLAPLS